MKATDLLSDLRPGLDESPEAEATLERTLDTTTEPRSGSPIAPVPSGRS